MSGAVSAGRPAACPTGRRTGRVCGLVVDAMRPCLCLVHACLGSPAAVPLFRIAAARPFPHDVAA